MIWGDDISFEGFQRIVDEWYRDKDFELCDPTDICFCDEENQMLSEMEKFENE